MNMSDILEKMISSSAVDSTSDENESRSPRQEPNITLWQFLLEILDQKKYINIIQWIMPRENGEFKLVDAEAVAKLWGQRKGKAKMNYDKLSRALRYYYDKGIIKKVVGQNFVYQFPASVMSPGSSASPPSEPNADEPTSSSISPVEMKIKPNHKRKLFGTPISSSSDAPAASSTPLTTSKIVKMEEGEPQPRKMQLEPLNISQTPNLTLPASTFLPMMLFQQNLYATFLTSLASAGLYGPQMSPLISSASPFSSLINTPEAATLAAQQVFQFPPTSTFPGLPLINPFSSLINPLSSFINPNNNFELSSSEPLITPKMPSS